MTSTSTTNWAVNTPTTSGNGLSQIQRLRPALGTLCAIAAQGHIENLEAAVTNAYAKLQQIDTLMHPTRMDSDLARLTAVLAKPVTIHAFTWEVLALARHINELSAGVFDPCLPTQIGCMSDIELLPDNQVVCHAPVAIDLGGIAKGYAVDQAIAALHESGCSSGVVNAGGDVRVFGEPQQFFINTGTDEPLQVTLHDCALAVSQRHAVDRPREHQGYYVRNTLERGHDVECDHVAVLASTAAVADALTKCGMFCNAIQFAELCAALNAEVLLPLI